MIVRVYGLSVAGLPRNASPDCSPPPDVTIRQTRVALPRPTATPGGRCVVALPAGQRLILDRGSRTATFVGDPVDDDELMHPHMSLIAQAFNRWAGRDALHAGVIELGGSAWLLLGANEAGKSTLLAYLATRGVSVLADDLAVTDGEVVFSGPRSLDLRDRPPWLELAVRAVRGGSRLRLALPAAPERLPLGGWIVLGAGEEPRLERVAGSDTVAVLLGARRPMPRLPSTPDVLFKLATSPGWTLTRPLGWQALPATAELLCRIVTRS